MSTSPSSPEDRPYGWSETEFYDTVEDRDRETGPTGHDEYPGTDRLEWVSHDILKQTARLLCATTLFGTPDRGWTPHMAAHGIPDAPDHESTAMHHERRELELTEPRVAMGKTRGDAWGHREYGYTGHNERVTPETGYLSGGESTGVVIADRPTEEFLAVVDLVVSAHCLRPAEADEVRTWAKKQKAAGEDRDVDILAGVLAMLDD